MSFNAMRIKLLRRRAGLIPWAYMAMILVSKPPNRRWPLRMNWGSKRQFYLEALRSLVLPASLTSVFLLVPLRWFSRFSSLSSF